MKKVLIIANLFHACPRIPAIAKYLKDFGWEPTILTVPIKEDPRNLLDFPENLKVRIIEVDYKGDIFSFYRKLLISLGFKKEKSLLNQINQGRSSQVTLVDRIFNFYQTLFAFPDEEKKWKKPVLRTAKTLLEKEKFDAIISSSSPVTCHVVASKLSQKYNLPWIADFRDLWTQNHNYSFCFLRKWLEKRYELKTLKRAKLLVAASPVWAEKLGSFHQKKAIGITNGFQPELVNKEKTNSFSKFTIVYSGTLYSENQDPSVFFEALKDFKEKMEVKFYTGKIPWLEKMIENYKLEERVRVMEKVARKEIIDIQNKAHALLLICWENEKGWVPLKIFNYFVSQKPILAIGKKEDNIIKKIIEETGTGVCLERKEEIKEFLENAYLEYKERRELSYHCNPEKVNSYSFKEKAREFSQALNEL